ncbi:HNH endonuclease [Variovorax sp. Varisp85]|uniref:HNH endonuclease n=1 Tax=Variovorax sp. Varisp85 TaxID=3243059 RepID=UPI0039A7161F
MTPLQRVRLEKAAADCGFEMTPVEHIEGLELRSALFPESVVVRPVGDLSFEVSASNAQIVSNAAGGVAYVARGFSELYDALRAAAARARTLPNRVADNFRWQTANLQRSTEAERLVVQRVGQNLFRASLLDYWQGHCCVSGLGIAELLRASHIKPWALCADDDERLDVFNGFLLAPHLDALFDAGLLTVDFDGAVRMSARVDRKDIESLGLPNSMAVSGLHDRHRHYLAFHHAKVWRG